MSFDLALTRGDLSVGETGELRTVSGTNKAVQDVLKVLHEPVGSNPLIPTLGSNLTSLNIGINMDPTFTESRVETSVKNTIQQLQQIQASQAQSQIVTPAERIVQINSIIAQVNEQDPRQFDIQLSITTGDLETVVLEPFTVNSTVLGDV